MYRPDIPNRAYLNARKKLLTEYLEESNKSDKRSDKTDALDKELAKIQLQFKRFIQKNPAKPEQFEQSIKNALQALHNLTRDAKQLNIRNLTIAALTACNAEFANSGVSRKNPISISITKLNEQQTKQLADQIKQLIASNKTQSASFLLVRNVLTYLVSQDWYKAYKQSLVKIYSVSFRLALGIKKFLADNPKIVQQFKRTPEYQTVVALLRGLNLLENDKLVKSICSRSKNLTEYSNCLANLVASLETTIILSSFVAFLQNQVAQQLTGKARQVLEYLQKGKVDTLAKQIASISKKHLKQINQTLVKLLASVQKEAQITSDKFYKELTKQLKKLKKEVQKAQQRLYQQKQKLNQIREHLNPTQQIAFDKQLTETVMQLVEGRYSYLLASNNSNPSSHKKIDELLLESSASVFLSEGITDRIRSFVVSILKIVGKVAFHFGLYVGRIIAWFLDGTLYLISPVRKLLAPIVKPYQQFMNFIERAFRAGLEQAFALTGIPQAPVIADMIYNISKSAVGFLGVFGIAVMPSFIQTPLNIMNGLAATYSFLVKYSESASMVKSGAELVSNAYEGIKAFNSFIDDLVADEFEEEQGEGEEKTE